MFKLVRITLATLNYINYINNGQVIVLKYSDDYGIMKAIKGVIEMAMVTKAKKEKKAKLTKAEKKKRLKKAFFCVLGAIVGIGAVLALTNMGVVNSCIKKTEEYKAIEYDDRVVPVKDENGGWVFKTDRELRVMQLTDVHFGGGFMSYEKDNMAINAVATMITAEKPDLVIITGDIAYPVPFQAGTFNNKSGAKILINLMEQLGVYWTVTFGNHDSEAYSYYDRSEVSGFYSDESLKYCLYQAGPEEVDGYGNHTIRVENSKGITTHAFVMMDSHSYTDGDFLGIFWKYDNIHQNQIDWYESEIVRISQNNMKLIRDNYEGDEANELLEKYYPVKSTAYFHIPLVEMKDAWFELEANGFKDTEDIKYIDGIIGETGKRIYPGIGEDNLFEKMEEMGSTKAIFNGHDHYNNVTFSKNDIIFSYGYSVDYLAYVGVSKEGSQRGCTMITVKEDGNIEINKYNYYSDRYDLPGFEKEDVTMQFDGVEYQVPDEE